MTEEKSELSDLKEKEKDFKEELQARVQTVEEKVDEAKELVQKYNDKVVDLVTEKPYIAVAGAFVVGYLVGKLAAHRWFV